METASEQVCVQEEIVEQGTVVEVGSIVSSGPEPSSGGGGSGAFGGASGGDPIHPMGNIGTHHIGAPEETGALLDRPLVMVG